MASRNVTFYGQGQRAPLGGSQIQRSYQNDPRRQMEQQLMKTGASTAPVQSIGEGITRALSGVAGGYFAGASRRDMEAREAERRQKITDVLAGANAPVETAPALNVPAEFADMGAALSRAPTPTEQQQRMIQGIGAIDPDMGLQMQMQQQQGDIERQRAEAARLQGIKDEKDMYKYEQDNAYRRPVEPKWSTPYKVADTNSPTGFSLEQVLPSGKTRRLGDAPPGAKMFDPDKDEKASRSKALSSRYEAATDSLREADSIMVDVNQMLELVGKVDSGTFAETKMEIAGAMKALGFEIDEAGLANAQAMRSKGMDFILARIAKTKGAISEKEMAAFKAASASLANTPEGNRMILDLTARVAERQKYVAQAIREGYGQEGMTRKKLDDLEIEARAQWDKANGGVVGGGGAAKKQPSEDDILATMNAHGMTREQVLERYNNGR